MFGIVPYVPEIICSHCGGKSFRENMHGNNICVRCQRHPADGSADNPAVNALARIMEPLGFFCSTITQSFFGVFS